MVAIVATSSDPQHPIHKHDRESGGEGEEKRRREEREKRRREERKKKRKEEERIQDKGKVEKDKEKKRGE